jgi:hypothetical protein
MVLFTIGVLKCVLYSGRCTYLSLLKSVFIDTIYMNVMRIESEYEGPDYMLCDDIDECVKVELHPLNIVHRVIEEDLAVENWSCCKVVLLNRMNIF